MKILFSLLLLVAGMPTNIFCMAGDWRMSSTEFREFIGEDRVGNNNANFSPKARKILAVDSNIYDPEPADNHAPLDAEYVLNSYWKNIARGDQQSKDAALEKIMSLDLTDYDYPLFRYHGAAAVLAGANPNSKKGYISLLAKAALHKDYDFCKLLLEHKADPNTEFYGKPVIIHVEKKSVAELFIHYGATVKLENYPLLEQAMVNGYEVELIVLYRAQGLSPFDTNKLINSSPLHYLARKVTGYSYENISDLYRKAFALCAGLSQDQIIKLINMRHKNHGTALDILAKNKSTGARALEMYLKSHLEMGKAARKQELQVQEKEAVCPICLDAKPDTLTTCNHSFCNPCLMHWLKEDKNNSCPMCRKLIVKL